MTSDIEKAIAKARGLEAKAQAELSRVCAANFTMRVHIPVQPDDSDVVIGDALNLIKALVDVVEAGKWSVESHHSDDSEDRETAYHNLQVRLDALARAVNGGE